jgi:hypothetical protein
VIGFGEVVPPVDDREEDDDDEDEDVEDFIVS